MSTEQERAQNVIDALDRFHGLIVKKINRLADDVEQGTKDVEAATTSVLDLTQHLDDISSVIKEHQQTAAQASATTQLTTHNPAPAE